MIAATVSSATEKQDKVKTAPQPAMEDVNGSTGHQLSVTCALTGSYLDAIKVQFHDRPDRYDFFIDIMKDLKLEESNMGVFSSR